MCVCLYIVLCVYVCAGSYVCGYVQAGTLLVPCPVKDLSLLSEDQSSVPVSRVRMSYLRTRAVSPLVECVCVI